LIKGGATTRHQHVEALIDEAADLIRLDPQVDWHGRLFSDESAYRLLTLLSTSDRSHQFVTSDSARGGAGIK
jgi:hypothetical protein